MEGENQGPKVENVDRQKSPLRRYLYNFRIGGASLGGAEDKNGAQIQFHISFINAAAVVAAALIGLCGTYLIGKQSNQNEADVIAGLKQDVSAKRLELAQKDEKIVQLNALNTDLSLKLNSKFDSANISLMMARANVSGSVKTCVSKVKSVMGENGYDLKSESADALWFAVNGDQVLIWCGEGNETLISAASTKNTPKDAVNIVFGVLE